MPLSTYGGNAADRKDPGWGRTWPKLTFRQKKVSIDWSGFHWKPDSPKLRLRLKDQFPNG